MKTLAELTAALEERDLCITIWTAAGPECWAVWLFCKDDPSLGICPADGIDLGSTIEAALKMWDDAAAAPRSEDDASEDSN